MIVFQPIEPPLFNPVVMASVLRGRILTRRALMAQAEGDVEKLKHEQAIADYERQIDELQGAGQ